jgi:hypothetical protein
METKILATAMDTAVSPYLLDNAGREAPARFDFARVFRRICGASPTEYRYEILR